MEAYIKDNDPLHKVSSEDFVYKLEILQSRINSFIHYYDIIPDGGNLIKSVKIKNLNNVKNIYEMNVRIPLQYNNMKQIPHLYKTPKLFYCGDSIYIDLLTLLNNLMSKEGEIIKELFWTPEDKEYAHTFNELADKPIKELVMMNLTNRLSISRIFYKDKLNPDQRMCDINNELYKVSFDISKITFNISTHVNYDALNGFNRFLTTYIEVLKYCKLARRRPVIKKRFGDDVNYYIANTIFNIVDEFKDPFDGILDIVLSNNGLSMGDVLDITPPKYVYSKTQKENIIDDGITDTLTDDMYLDNNDALESKKYIDDCINRICDKFNSFDSADHGDETVIKDIEVSKTIFVNKKVTEEDLTNLVSSKINYDLLSSIFNTNDISKRVKGVKESVLKFTQIVTDMNLDTDDKSYLDSFKSLGKLSIWWENAYTVNVMKRKGQLKTLVKNLKPFIVNKDTINFMEIFDPKRLDKIFNILNDSKIILNNLKQATNLLKFKLSELQMDETDLSKYYDILSGLNYNIMRNIINTQSDVMCEYINLQNLTLICNWKARYFVSDNNPNKDIIYSIVDYFINPLIRLCDGSEVVNISEELFIMNESGSNFNDGENYYNSPEKFPERERYFGRSIRPMMQTDNATSLSSLFITELPQVIAALIGRSIESLLMPTNIKSNKKKAEIMTDILDETPKYPIPISDSLYVRSGEVKPIRIKTQLNGLKDSLFNYVTDNPELLFNNDDIASDNTSNIHDLRYIKENDASDALLKKFNFELFINLVTLNGNPVNSSLLLSNFNSSFGLEEDMKGIENTYFNPDNIIIMRYINVLKSLIDTVDDSYSINTARNGNIFDDLVNAELIFGDMLFSGISRLFSNVGGLDIYFRGGLTTPKMYNISRQITDFKIKKKDVLLMQLLNNFFISYDNILLDEDYSKTIADTIYNKDITFNLNKITLLDFITRDDLDDTDINDNISITYNGTAILNTILLLWNNMIDFRGAITKLDKNSHFTKTEAINILTPLLIFMIAKLGLNLREYDNRFLEQIKRTAEKGFDSSK